MNLRHSYNPDSRPGPAAWLCSPAAVVSLSSIRLEQQDLHPHTFDFQVPPRAIVGPSASSARSIRTIEGFGGMRPFQGRAEPVRSHGKGRSGSREATRPWPNGAPGVSPRPRSALRVTRGPAPGGAKDRFRGESGRRTPRGEAIFFPFWG